MLVDNGTNRELTADVDKNSSTLETAIAARPHPTQPGLPDIILIPIEPNTAEFRCWIPAQGLIVSALMPSLSFWGGNALAALLLLIGVRAWRRRNALALRPLPWVRSATTSQH